MKIMKLLAIGLATYIVLVFAFETLVVVMGKRQADHGVQPGEHWLVITTNDAQGSHNTVVAGVEIDAQLYVAANHWPRGWYKRALANPDVLITRDGKRQAYRAAPVTGEERVRVAERYRVPWVVRFLTGFPPRAFLRLSPVTT